jgi:hypothetical protein
MSPFSWIAVALGALMIYGLWAASRPRWTVKIVVEGSDIQSHQGLAKARLLAVREFFRRDVRLDQRIVIRALRDHSGNVRLDISGQIDPGTKQQIRNYLITML